MPIRPLALALALACAAALPLAAQDHGMSAADAERIAVTAETQLRSPVTPGHTLDMCPSVEAQALRDTVMTMALAGMSSDRIVETVIERRGEDLRIVPRKSGTGLLAWIAPPLVLLIGGGIVMARLRAVRGRGEVLPGVAAPITTDDREMLDRAMREMEREEAAT
ncbi:MAG TPA: cytochrome c-type biogenesis protein CcmH [Longimicrobiaceae bacterium]|nr:cytochrome c-type biogenesis protein CcmH [Longimicrobiaceae bacterium]